MQVTKSKNHIGSFQIKKFYSERKITVKTFVLTRVLFVTSNFNNCAMLLRENSTNSLKVEKRPNQSCKILIDIL